MLIIPKIIDPCSLPVFEKNPEEKVILFDPTEHITIVEPGHTKYMIPYFSVDEKEVASWFGLQELYLMISTKVHRGIYITVVEINDRTKFGGAIIELAP